MFIFGKNYTKKEILEKIGDISQIGGMKNYEYADGVSKGIRAIDMDNGNGLEITVLLDRCLDIGKAAYKGASLIWKSAIRETHPSYYDKEHLEWMKTFFGGLLVTCGLTYFGNPCNDNDEQLGLHGRISNTPAHEIISEGLWKGDDYWIYIKGKVREANINGYKLEMERKISMKIGDNKIYIEDRIENFGYKTSPLMTLYHLNFGFPLIDAGTVLELFEHKTVMYLDDAVNYKENYTVFFEPSDCFNWRVYLHDLAADSEGNCTALIANNSFRNNRGLGLYLKYNKGNLPYLNEWVMMSKGDYVVGIEPCNAPGRGRNIERKEKYLRFIEPGQIIINKIEVGILENNNEISAFINK